MNVGDIVRWSSQAGGHHKTKEGMIVEVVNPNARPSSHITGGTTCSGRNHESYVVNVGNKRYWPVVSGLTKIS